MRLFALALLPLTIASAQCFGAEQAARAMPGARRIGGLAARDASAGKTQSRVFPRILAGSDWETTVVLLNPGSSPVTFQQFFFGGDGKLAQFAVQNTASPDVLTTSGISGILLPGSS